MECKKYYKLMIVVLFSLLTHYLGAQDQDREPLIAYAVAENDIFAPLSLPEREACAIGSLGVLSLFLGYGFYKSLMESRPVNRYTICNHSNSTVYILHENDGCIACPVQTIMKNENCFGTPQPGYLSHLCASFYDFDSYNDHVIQCATENSLKYNFEWDVDENLFFNRKSNNEVEQKFTSSEYVTLAKDSDNNSSFVLHHYLRSRVE